jgi:soluble lytic murein transglycosylase
VVQTLAAYNAGRTPVLRWAERAGTSDPELFTERIGYAETRDYVRVIQRNIEIYRSLYDWAS